MLRLSLLNIFLMFVVTAVGAEPTKEEAKQGLLKAVKFFHEKVATQGGYVWRVSSDLTMKEGEGLAGDSKIWIQPPGTPAVGQAFLDAYDATGEQACLQAAKDTAAALLKGQANSGGWDHHVEMDAKKRLEYGYRDLKNKKQGHTSMDDDITPSAVRLLIRLDNTLQFRDEKLHEATLYALNSMVGAQYPNGAWYMWWEQFPTKPYNSQEFPIKKASYPETWSRKWGNDWTGRYFLNDRITQNGIAAMLAAFEIYGDERYFNSAERGGEFLLLAQMPEPQPAWAQQYNPQMQPVWDRKFEPPAITGLESQDVLETLMLLFRKTGDKRYLEPIPRALAYLKKSQLPSGQLARFYELQTNRPLFFQRTGSRYDLTYDGDDTPAHYGFFIPSRLDSISAEYQRLTQTPIPPTPSPIPADLSAQVRTILDSLDPRGAWTTPGTMRSYQKVQPADGILDSAVFIHHIQLLCQFIRT